MSILHTFPTIDTDDVFGNILDKNKIKITPQNMYTTDLFLDKLKRFEKLESIQSTYCTTDACIYLQPFELLLQPMHCTKLI